jgi:tRNA(fMet)-specific endonuclease VapC
MAAVVVDTDVISFLFRNDSRAELYRPHLTDRLLIVSFMTVAELELWTLQRGWGGARHARLEA